MLKIEAVLLQDFTLLKEICILFELTSLSGNMNNDKIKPTPRRAMLS